MFGDLSGGSNSRMRSSDSSAALSSMARTEQIPSFSVHEIEGRELGIEPGLSNEEEDVLLIDTTGSFADWVTGFVRRVIQLLENLPEEGPNGTAGGATEGDSECLSSWVDIK